MVFKIFLCRNSHQRSDEYETNALIQISGNILNLSFLLLKSSIKRAEITLDIQHDIINVFGGKILIITSSSEHYAIPIANSKQVTAK